MEPSSLKIESKLWRTIFLACGRSFLSVGEYGVKSIEGNKYHREYSCRYWNWDNVKHQLACHDSQYSRNPRTSPWVKSTWTGITVHVNIRSATAMLAINKFMTLIEDDPFKTANNPIELPSKAIVKITAYAHLILILNSWDMPSGTMGGAVDAAEENKNCQSASHYYKQEEKAKSFFWTFTNLFSKLLKILW